MSVISFLLDEHMPASVSNALLALVPGIQVRLVGVDPDVPPKQTPDPELLRFAESEGYSIVTFDKDTMPSHLTDHLASGRHTRGVFLFLNGNDLNAGIIAGELVIVWTASDPDEWADRLVFLPL